MESNDLPLVLPLRGAMLQLFRDDLTEADSLEAAMADDEALSLQRMKEERLAIFERERELERESALPTPANATAAAAQKGKKAVTKPTKAKAPTPDMLLQEREEQEAKLAEELAQMPVHRDPYREQAASIGEVEKARADSFSEYNGWLQHRLEAFSNADMATRGGASEATVEGRFIEEVLGDWDPCPVPTPPPCIDVFAMAKTHAEYLGQRFGYRAPRGLRDVGKIEESENPDSEKQVGMMGTHKPQGEGMAKTTTELIPSPPRAVHLPPGHGTTARATFASADALETNADGVLTRHSSRARLSVAESSADTGPFSGPTKSGRGGKRTKAAHSPGRSKSTILAPPKEPLEVSMRHVEFHECEPTKCYTAVIRCWNKDGCARGIRVKLEGCTDVTLFSAETVKPDLHLDPVVPGAAFDVRVQFFPKDTAAHSATLVIGSSRTVNRVDPTRNAHSQWAYTHIPISCSTMAPRLEISALKAMDTCFVGSSSFQQCTVKNVGCKGRVELAASGSFGVSPSQLMMDPQEEIDVTLRFDPNVAGDATGELTATSFLPRATVPVLTSTFPLSAHATAPVVSVTRVGTVQFRGGALSPSLSSTPIPGADPTTSESEFDEKPVAAFRPGRDVPYMVLDDACAGAVTSREIEVENTGKLAVPFTWHLASDGPCEVEMKPATGKLAPGRTTKFTFTMNSLSASRRDTPTLECVAALALNELPRAAAALGVRNSAAPHVMKKEHRNKPASTTDPFHIFTPKLLVPQGTPGSEPILVSGYCCAALRFLADPAPATAFVTPNVLSNDAACLMNQPNLREVVVVNTCGRDLPFWFDPPQGLEHPRVNQFPDGANRREQHQKAMRDLYGPEYSAPVQSPRHQVDVSVHPQRGIVPANGSMSVTLSFMVKQPGPMECEVECYMPDLDDSLFVKIAAVGRGPALDVSTRNLEYGVLPLGGEAEGRFTLTNVNPLPVRFSLMDLHESETSMSLSDSPGSDRMVFLPDHGLLKPKQSVQITAYLRGRVPGPFCDQIRVCVEDGISTNITVRASVQEPEVALRPSTVNVGPVDRNVTQSAATHLVNLSAVSVTYNVVTVEVPEGMHVEVDQTTGVLHAGATQPLPVQITCSGLKPCTAVMALYSPQLPDFVIFEVSVPEVKPLSVSVAMSHSQDPFPTLTSTEFCGAVLDNIIGSAVAMSENLTCVGKNFAPSLSPRGASMDGSPNHGTQGEFPPSAEISPNRNLTMLAHSPTARGNAGSLSGSPNATGPVNAAARTSIDATDSRPTHFGDAPPPPFVTPYIPAIDVAMDISGKQPFCEVTGEITLTNDSGCATFLSAFAEKYAPVTDLAEMRLEQNQDNEAASVVGALSQKRAKTLAGTLGKSTDGGTKKNDTAKAPSGNGGALMSSRMKVGQVVPAVGNAPVVKGPPDLMKKLALTSGTKGKTFECKAHNGVEAEERMLKALLQDVELLLCDGRGFAVGIENASGHLAPYSSWSVKFRVVANVPGIYEDALVIYCQDLPPLRIPIRMTVRGLPLVVDPLTSGLFVNQRSGVAALQMPTLVAGMAVSRRKIVVTNRCPRDLAVSAHVVEWDKFLSAKIVEVEELPFTKTTSDERLGIAMSGAKEYHDDDERRYDSFHNGGNDSVATTQFSAAGGKEQRLATKQRKASLSVRRRPSLAGGFAAPGPSMGPDGDCAGKATPPPSPTDPTLDGTLDGDLPLAGISSTSTEAGVSGGVGANASGSAVDGDVAPKMPSMAGSMVGANESNTGPPRVGVQVEARYPTEEEARDAPGHVAPSQFVLRALHSQEITIEFTPRPGVEISTFNASVVLNATIASTVWNDKFIIDDYYMLHRPDLTVTRQLSRKLRINNTVAATPSSPTAMNGTVGGATSGGPSKSMTGTSGGAAASKTGPSSSAANGNGGSSATSIPRLALRYPVISRANIVDNSAVVYGDGAQPLTEKQEEERLARRRETLSINPADASSDDEAALAAVDDGFEARVKVESERRGRIQSEREELLAFMKRRREMDAAVTTDSFMPLEMEMHVRQAPPILHVDPDGIVEFDEARLGAGCQRQVRLVNGGATPVLFHLDVDGPFAVVRGLLRKHNAVRTTQVFPDSAPNLTEADRKTIAAATIRAPHPKSVQPTPTPSVALSSPNDALGGVDGAQGSAPASSASAEPRPVEVNGSSRATPSLPPSAPTPHPTDSFQIQPRASVKGTVGRATRKGAGAAAATPLSDVKFHLAPHEALELEIDLIDLGENIQHQVKGMLTALFEDDSSQKVMLYATVHVPTLSCAPAKLHFRPGVAVTEGRKQPSYTKTIELVNTTLCDAPFTITHEPMEKPISHSGAPMTRAELMMTALQAEEHKGDKETAKNSSALGATGSPAEANNFNIDGPGAFGSAPFVDVPSFFHLSVTEGVVPAATRGGAPAKLPVVVTFTEHGLDRFQCKFVVRVEGGTGASFVLRGDSRETELLPV